MAVAHSDAGVTEGRIFLAAPLEPGHVSRLFRSNNVLAWDYRTGTLLSRSERRLGEILVDTKPAAADPAQVAGVLLEVIQKVGLGLFTWTDEALQLQARVQSLNLWRPEENMPDLSSQALLANPELYFEPYVSSIKKKDDFEKLDLAELLGNSLNYGQMQRLNALVPGQLKVPSGFFVPLKYLPDGGRPVLAVRIQEVFGLTDTPAVNEGRTPVLLHLLSPGYKPVQVTQDLRSFWANAYPAVRKELKIRYPKHSWPEDPWTAEAVRKGPAQKRQQ